MSKLRIVLIVFAGIGTIGGFVFGITSIANDAPFYALPLIMLMGFTIGFGVSSLWATIKWAWKIVKPVLGFFFPFNNADSSSTFVQIKFIVGLCLLPFLLFPFSSVIASPIVSIVKFIIDD